MPRSRSFFLRLVCLVAFAACCTLDVSAQLSLQVTVGQYRHMAYEPVSLNLRVRNDSGNPLSFRDGGTFSLQVRHNGKFIASRLAKDKGKNPIHALTLPAGAEKSISLQINRFAQLQRPGEYEVVVRVGHRRLRSDYRARPAVFSVSHGIEVWHRSVGVPRPNSAGEIASRRIAIVRFRGDHGDLNMLKIEDDQYVYAVSRLGPSIVGVTPQGEVDARSFVHTMVQTAPRQFEYRTFDLAGKQKEVKVYLFEGTNPRLVRDPDLGRVIVLGGRLAVEGLDFNTAGEGPTPAGLDDAPGVGDVAQPDDTIIEDLPDMADRAKE
ncbi:MAG TPA: hypothetical protein DCR55_08500 [Lentisphaeria bacterium]|nr:hypothetical protein [Lentisphaeria bacterium]